MTDNKDESDETSEDDFIREYENIINETEGNEDEEEL